MTRFVSASERIQKAWSLIQKARDLPVPVEGGKYGFSYVARVKALLQDARDLVKFIPKTPSATVEMKDEVKKIFLAAEQADREILH